MQILKFLTNIFASFILLISYGFAKDVKVTIPELPHEFESSVFEIVFRNIGSPPGWPVTLEHVHTEQIVEVDEHADWQNIVIQRKQLGETDEIPCVPQNFDYHTKLKVEVQHSPYRGRPHDGLSCTVTGE